MQHNDMPDRSEDSGLTTEDIAGFGDPDAGGGQESQAPMYPGEATRTAPETEPAETEPMGSEAMGSEGAGTEPEAEGRGAGVRAGEGAQDNEDLSELLSADDVEAFRSRWQEIQNQFVDDPREAVHSADGLVADVMRTLAETFADHKKDLEGQWNQGEAVDTESLRNALRQYRSFFNRLLTK
ncbi:MULTISPECIES: hypothetical protein [Streptomyces]|uniref:hypothetical protein n=1 Tax=Streptomyces TaxID=1883 RepID=UPI0013180B75|nr:MULTISPECIES: hypothetical protein [Streptomyces]QGZ52157.1 hypothetical protein GPZ77_30745 [Streptomyces sp. QHH-9511]GGT73792.1 hypothetical protein GCM10010272_16460 [Streptomyces lateritius]